MSFGTHPQLNPFTPEWFAQVIGAAASSAATAAAQAVAGSQRQAPPANPAAPRRRGASTTGKCRIFGRTVLNTGFVFSTLIWLTSTPLRSTLLMPFFPSLHRLHGLQFTQSFGPQVGIRTPRHGRLSYFILAVLRGRMPGSCVRRGQWATGFPLSSWTTRWGFYLTSRPTLRSSCWTRFLPMLV